MKRNEKGELYRASAPVKNELPWYGWLLAPLVLPAVLLVAILLGLLALLSVPYFALYPDRHADIIDFGGNAREREWLAKWRAKYAQLGFLGRIRRCMKLRR